MKRILSLIIILSLISAVFFIGNNNIKVINKGNNLIKIDSDLGNKSKNSTTIVPSKIIGISVVSVGDGVLSIIDKSNLTYKYKGKELILNVYLLKANITVYNIYQISGDTITKILNYNDRDGIFTYYVLFNRDSTLILVISTNRGQFSITIKGIDTDTVTVNRIQYEKYRELWDGAVERVREAEQIFGVKFDDKTPEGILHAWDESLDDSKALRQGVQGVVIQSLAFFLMLFLYPSNALIMLWIILFFLAIAYKSRLQLLKVNRIVRGVITDDDIKNNNIIMRLKIERGRALQEKIRNIALRTNVPKHISKYIEEEYTTIGELYRDFLDTYGDDFNNSSFGRKLDKMISMAKKVENVGNPYREIPDAIIRMLRYVYLNIKLEGNDELARKINVFERYIKNRYNEDIGKMLNSNETIIGLDNSIDRLLNGS